METTYTHTHTTWHVRPGREAEFVERWREWVDWSRREGFEAQARLLRDLGSPQTFVSFDPWESVAAVRNWRMGRVGIEPTTLGLKVPCSTN
jgi:heme-degrading monooxygenase HmoA